MRTEDGAGVEGGDGGGDGEVTEGGEPMTRVR
jgi:hypothetical protein